MKKNILSFVAFIACSFSAIAQIQMHVNMKNGSMLNFFTSEIEEITWDLNVPDIPSENLPDETTVTGDATDISVNSATITCYANNILENESNDLSVGIIYCTEGTPSKNNGIQKTVNKSQIEEDGRFVITLTELNRGTTYFYRSFVYQSGLWFYGEVKSFATIDQSIDIQIISKEVSDVTCYCAKILAQIIIPSSLSYYSLNYGICYGTTTESTTKIETSLNKDEDGYFYTTLKALEGNATYYYRPYAEVDGEVYYGQVSSFKTLKDNVVITGEVDDKGRVKSQLVIGNGAYSSLEVGLCWSYENEFPSVYDISRKSNELDEENCFTVNLIDYGNIYYRAYVSIDGVMHYDTVKQICKEYICPPAGEPIDLGLFSGIKWASCNIGAYSPEDYGFYYAWGETKPKLVNYNSYFDISDDHYTFKKYYNYGGMTILESQDDAAAINWGENWRMPTQEECKELIDHCTWIWTTENGVYGFQVIGPNGNKIFLPAAGFRPGYHFESEEYLCFYWSSSLANQDNSSCYARAFGGSQWNYYASLYNDLRIYLGPIRPVCP